MFLGAMAAFIIDKKFEWATLFAGAVLSFFGFIHGTSLGVANSAPVALGYLIVAGVCYALTRQSTRKSLFQPRRSLRMPSERTDRR
jgi:AGZA family xanthine/uracil permease-like MFS transporter